MSRKKSKKIVGNVYERIARLLVLGCSVATNGYCVTALGRLICVIILSMSKIWFIVKKIVGWILLLLFAGVLCTPIFAFIGVIVSESFAGVVQKWFGTEGKKDTLQFLIGITGGVAGLYGLFTLGKRVAAQEKGLVQDRFKAAIDHLSNENSELSRIASFHELFYLAKDNKDAYAQTILDVLCTHLRQITKYEDIKIYHEAYNHPEEVKFLARILFGRKTGKVFNGLRFNLKQVNLTGIDFRGMKNPKKVDFSFAFLSHAVFNGTNLSGANFYDATLSKAKFVKTNLKGANFRKTELQNADLREANFSKAKMKGAILQGAKCSKTNFYKTTFLYADFCNADLHEAKNLQTANLLVAKHNKDEDGTGTGTQFPDGLIPRGMDYQPLLMTMKK